MQIGEKRLLVTRHRQSELVEIQERDRPNHLVEIEDAEMAGLIRDLCEVAPAPGKRLTPSELHARVEVIFRDLGLGPDEQNPYAQVVARMILKLARCEQEFQTTLTLADRRGGA